MVYYPKKSKRTSPDFKKKLRKGEAKRNEIEMMEIKRRIIIQAKKKKNLPRKKRRKFRWKNGHVKI